MRSNCCGSSVFTPSVSCSSWSASCDVRASAQAAKNAHPIASPPATSRARLAQRSRENCLGTLSRWRLKLTQAHCLFLLVGFFFLFLFFLFLVGLGGFLDQA